MRTLDLLQAVVQAVWTSPTLPEGVARVEVTRMGDDLYVAAIPDRWPSAGRAGFALIDESIVGEPFEAPSLRGHLKSQSTAVDVAAAQAVACCWFDSSYA